MGRRKAGEDAYVPSIGELAPERRPSEDDSEDEYAPRRGESAYTGVGRSSEDTYAPSVSSGRTASQDTTTVSCRSEDREQMDMDAEAGTCEAEVGYLFIYLFV